MRAALYNPYLDTMGGGERYTLFFGKALHELGYEVFLSSGDGKILDKAKTKFGEDFDFIKIVPDINRGDGYDLVFWVSDGSIPILRSRKNILHFQVPFKDTKGNTLLNKMKLFRVKKIICNSLFTKKTIDEEYNVKSSILYPPIDTEKLKPLKKENLILYVGRFSELMQSKRQDVLIDVFKKMVGKGKLKNWKLVIGGGTEVGTGNNVKRLKKMIGTFPITIYESPSHKDVVSLFGRAKFFWSAAGYDIDEKKEPQRMEHFGMSLVEAMAAGALPLAFSGGGHKEIIKSGENGYLWQKQSELAKYTLDLIANKTAYDKVVANAIKFSKSLNYENFKEAVREIID